MVFQATPSRRLPFTFLDYARFFKKNKENKLQAPECYNRKTSFSLAAFTKLRNATINITMPVRPSAWNNSTPTQWIFIKFDVKTFFESFVPNLMLIRGKDKGKAIPLQAWTGPEGS